MNTFIPKQMKNQLMGYLTVVALFLALLTPMFMQSNDVQKALKIDENHPALIVDKRVELTEKEDAQWVGKWVRPWGRKSKALRTARSYAWSD